MNTVEPILKSKLQDLSNELNVINSAALTQVNNAAIIIEKAASKGCKCFFYPLCEGSGQASQKYFYPQYAEEPDLNKHQTAIFNYFKQKFPDCKVRMVEMPLILYSIDDTGQFLAQKQLHRMMVDILTPVNASANLNNAKLWWHVLIDWS